MTPNWLHHPWLADLRGLTTSPFLHLPLQQDLLNQGSIVHPQIEMFQLAAWRLNSLAWKAFCSQSLL